MKELYDKVALKCSRLTTRSYSTSFSLGIRFLAAHLRDPIYAIYGFVRFADEIVDSFHDFDKEKLLDQFSKDTFDAIKSGISLNPVIHSFQNTARTYNIDPGCVEAFLASMRMDLSPQNYTCESYGEYILGSAEVVGLMCLSVFVNGDPEKYDKLKPYAMKLGSAFQKINFLRDFRADYYELGRSYFPGVEINGFDEKSKSEIEADIEADFKMGKEGIKMLPRDARFGVFVAYVYYFQLFRKIKQKHSAEILKKRIRISNKRKFVLLFSSYLRHSFNRI